MGFSRIREKKETGSPSVGAVLFDRNAAVPAQFYEVVPRVVIDTWLPRKTQICMVELVGAVIALETFRDYVRDKSILLLVDAEDVEGALVKGYSARCDICELIGQFWDLALELN